MIFKQAMLARYFILGTQNVASEAVFFDVLTQALAHGITLFQYREKGPGALTGSEKRRVAQRVRELTTQYQVPLVIDDDIDLAHAIKADGVHFGQGDGDIKKNIQASQPLFVGVSVSTQEEYDRIAGLSGIDNVGIGPVFATMSKADAKPAIGISGLQGLVRQSQWPAIAIGGISQANLPDVLKTGVAGASVISMISASENIAKTLAFWKQLS
ncbi:MULTISPECIES: thiamine phosphate synthase [Leuconostoc]|uniref:Thiamine-phosphate synthase n=2 Tax=Leuconostoc kimchii TaxID=136609 RepID=D5T2R3_LEUKI|nr:MULTISPECIES: thiamine phosphate synthase [Leuconostoc]ADG40562.1 thiamine-phosphate pyrophosphorylase [Leuconostoc kimchii IMSNU 11154]AEJ31514.1 thiamine-phosphate pyrophosphorylase [Leuconostoc sp. C2]QBR47026.1 thiamine phosphate synthase [Leuconostoc kimchii]